MRQHILVSGAGIAGCVTAYWLHRFGYQVTVVERAPGPRPGGQAVDLRGAGRTVVDRMGLLPRVREVTLQQKGIAWVDTNGQRRAAMPVEAFGGNGIISSDEVLRGDLANVVYEHIAESVDLRFDDTITGLRDREDGMEVSFENSATEQFDLVIGADGLHSPVRRLAFGADDDLLRPLRLATAWFTAPAEVELDGWSLVHNARGGRVVSIRPGRLSGEQKVGLSMRADPPSGRLTLEQQRARFADAFEQVDWQGQRMARHARSAEDFFAEDVAQVVMPDWSKGRLALVGDAAYCSSPLSGLGASVALVAGYVLAGELHRHRATDYQTALHSYQHVISGYVHQAQELPPGGVASFAPRTRIRIAQGHASMRAATRWPMRLILDRVFAKADNIDLPEYPLALIAPSGITRSTPRVESCATNDQYSKAWQGPPLLRESFHNSWALSRG